MDKESSKDGDSIPAQLLSQSAWVLHVQDLPSHQEDDPKRKVPAGGQAETPDEVGDELGTTGTTVSKAGTMMPRTGTTVPQDSNHCLQDRNHCLQDRTGLLLGVRLVYLLRPDVD